MNENQYDEWKLADGLEDEHTVTICDCCYGDIYTGEEHIYIPMFDHYVHEGCLSGHLVEMVDTERKVGF